MGRRKLLKPHQIAVLMALHKGGKSSAYINKEPGINKRTVQIWVMTFRESKDGDVPLPRLAPVKPRKITPYTLKLIERQIEADPTLTSCQIKERNNNVLGKIGGRTVRKYLHDFLHYTRRPTRKKPLITAAKKSIDWHLHIK